MDDMDQAPYCLDLEGADVDEVIALVRRSLERREPLVEQIAERVQLFRAAVEEQYDRVLGERPAGKGEEPR
jgi:hypothetical protein